MQTKHNAGLLLVLVILLSLLPLAPAAAAADLSDWSQNAIVFPKRDHLNPCGPVEIKWKNIAPYGGNASSYTVYADGVYLGAVSQTDDECLTFAWYSTEVAKHTVRVEAVGTGVSTEADFYLSKKGLGYYDQLTRMQDMNISWYYNWGPTPSTDACVKGIDFTPMIWNASHVNWLNAPVVADYDTVLGFNEPDLPWEGNVPVAQAVALWPAFVNSGKRLGSPAVALSYQWLSEFMDGVNNQVDFITVHAYYYSAPDFKNLIQNLYNIYHKPIWITEFATEGNFMQEVLPWLDTQPYVERYAWFTGMAGNLVDADTGTLTDQGRLYRDLGNPSDTYGFVPVKDIAVTETTAVAGMPFELTGRVSPWNAANKAIVWSVKAAGTVGASVSGNTLYMAAAGTVVVLATVSGGAPGGADYVKEITMTVLDQSAAVDWAKTAVVSPLKDSLSPVGQIEIMWKNITAIGGDIPFYNVYADGMFLGKVPQTQDEFLTFEWYSAKTAKHTITVEAAGADIWAEADFYLYDGSAMPADYPPIPSLWPENGDKIVLRADSNGMYVRPGNSPEKDTMIADQVMLTDLNLVQCTFEVVTRYGKIFLKAYNSLFIAVADSGYGSNKIWAVGSKPERVDAWNALSFEPQGDGTFIIHSGNDYYIDVTGSGALRSVENHAGDTGKFIWEYVAVDLPGVMITGKTASYNPNTPATVQLLQNDQIKYTTATETTPGSGQSSQPFKFENVAPGDYTLLITKPGHTSFTVQTVTVGSAGLDLTQDPRPAVQTMALLCGDLNGDGYINDSDLAVLWQAANYNKSADQAANKLCDLNGDGYVNDSDLAILWQAVNYNKGAVVVP